MLGFCWLNCSTSFLAVSMYSGGPQTMSQNCTSPDPVLAAAAAGAAVGPPAAAPVAGGAWAAGPAGGDGEVPAGSRARPGGAPAPFGEERPGKRGGARGGLLSGVSL